MRVSCVIFSRVLGCVLRWIAWVLRGVIMRNFQVLFGFAGTCYVVGLGLCMFVLLTFVGTSGWLCFLTFTTEFDFICFGGLG